MIKNLFLAMLFSTAFLTGCQGDRLESLEKRSKVQQELIKSNSESNEAFGLVIINFAKFIVELDQRLTKVEEDSKKGCRIR